LVYKKPWLELEAGGDLLPDLLDDTLVRVFVLNDNPDFILSKYILCTMMFLSIHS